MLRSNYTHSIIFVESKFSNLNSEIKNFMKSICCDKQPFCNQCEFCKKINEDRYADLMEINGDMQNISKEQITQIKSRFNRAGFESINKKFYVIYNFENASKEAINSLLKFIEEPLPSTYAILTTRSISKILPTIKSRCHVYRLKSNKKYFEENINKFELNEKQKKIVFETYFDLDEFITDYNSGDFMHYYDFIKKIVTNYDDIKTIKELSLEFKELDYFKIKKILLFYSVLQPNFKKELLDLINKLNLYPTKISVFNSIWNLSMENK